MLGKLNCICQVLVKNLKTTMLRDETELVTVLRQDARAKSGKMKPDWQELELDKSTSTGQID